MAHVWSNRNLDPIELASLYEWLDRVPLSRNRVQVEKGFNFYNFEYSTNDRNSLKLINDILMKDFADGLLAAEVVKYYFPNIIDMKELRTAKNLNERQMQWQFLNTHLFSKIGLSIPPHVVTQLCISKTGVAQLFLYNLRAILTLNGANTGAIPVPVFREPPPVIMRAPPPMLASSYDEQWFQHNGRQNLVRDQVPLSNVYKDEYDYYWQKKQAERVVKSDKANHLPKSNSMKGQPNNGRISLPLLKNPPALVAPPINSYIVAAAPPPIHLDLAAARIQLDEKTSQIIEKDDEVQFLKGQLRRMEVLLQSKNAKIQELLDLLDKEKKERERQRKPFVNF